MAKPQLKMPSKPAKEEPKKMRVSSAKAGTAVKVDADYFPPQNSVAYTELVRIAESGKDGIDVWDYKLSEMFLGRIIRVGLVDCIDGKLHATERLDGVLDGSIVLSRGSEFNQLHAQLKKVTDPEQFASIITRLKELGDARVQANVERAERKSA